IMPKMKRIFSDFDEPLPPVTDALVRGWAALGDYEGIVAAVIPLVVLVVAALIASPGVRWYTPFLGRLYRWEAQGLILRMLSALVEVGRPIPKALALLAETADFPLVVRRCLNAAQTRVTRGEPLATALRRAGLL